MCSSGRIGQRGLLDRQAELFGDHRAAGEDGDVLEHFLATIAKARRLDGGDLEDATQVVDDQRRERFAFDVFGDDHQRTAALGDARSEEHTSELQSLMRSSYAVSCLKKKTRHT